MNLGSPDEPTAQSVARYLREFLMDPMVIDRPWWLRFLLVNGVIVPFRRHRSAHAYQRIWTDRGSPLKIHTAALAKEVQAELGPTWRVDWAMRYGSPSLQSLLELLASEQPKELVVLPLYPQWAKSSGGTVIEMVRRAAVRFQGRVEVIEPFFGKTEFIEPYVRLIQESWSKQPGDYLLFSFHGLPERHVREIDAAVGGCLQRPHCCDQLTERNQRCYRAQAFETARLISQKLHLVTADWGISFQSRLGREPWIQPFTDRVLPELIKSGRRRVVVVCPAFVADCLETLEEIGLNARDQVRALGGELILLPCLNERRDWAQALSKAIQQNHWSRQLL